MGSLSESQGEGDETQDLKLLLLSLLRELKEVKDSLTLSQPAHDRFQDMLEDAKWATSGGISTHPQKVGPEANSQRQAAEYSIEVRSGPLLREALARYDSDAIPHWSTLYGTYLTEAAGPELPEETLRRLDWSNLIGGCWRIPHDNRVGLCFLASPLHTPVAVARVRNFLSHYHRSHDSSLPKGDYFNIWDWFDTGISAFWYPGKRHADIEHELSDRRGVLSSLQTDSGAAHVSQLVAPWRRIM